MKQLSTLAGITPRTLHYYDEIGLLKPSRIGENGYRHYDEESLIQLQQIMLYRELGLPLDSIKRLLSHPDFDVLNALENHKQELRNRITQLERLISTVEDTILYITGEKDMDQKNLFVALSKEQEAEMEKEALQMYNPETVKASFKKWKGYSPEEKQHILDEGNAVYLEMVEAMPKGAASPESQACVERWHQHMNYFWTPTKDQLLQLADGYNDDPRFKANFDNFHSGLAAFIREAVRVYVRNIKE